jgi:hypothetical protein
MKRKVTLQSSHRKNYFIEIPLTLDGDREAATILVDGIFHHLERIKKETLLSQYVIDQDTDYEPQTDTDGYCYILSPFCK